MVKVAASWPIARADRTLLNVEGAFQHILNDLFAFIATAVAGLVLLLTGWGLVPTPSPRWWSPR